MQEKLENECERWLQFQFFKQKEASPSSQYLISRVLTFSISSLVKYTGQRDRFQPLTIIWGSDLVPTYLYITEHTRDCVFGNGVFLRFVAPLCQSAYKVLGFLGSGFSKYLLCKLGVGTNRIYHMQISRWSRMNQCRQRNPSCNFIESVAPPQARAR